MAFHDVRLPEDVERGAQGGPRFKTTIIGLSSGFEKRNIDWQDARGAWDVGYGIDSDTNFRLTSAFFWARQGRAHSFRFKDWGDYQLEDQLVFTTDGSTNTFTLFKRYTSGGINFDRPLEKIVSGVGSVTVNAVTQTLVFDAVPASGEVSVAALTGIVTLGSTHAATTGQAVNMTLEYDVPVRFDTDALDLNLTVFNAGAIPSLPVIEVRGE